MKRFGRDTSRPLLFTLLLWAGVVAASWASPLLGLPTRVSTYPVPTAATVRCAQPVPELREYTESVPETTAATGPAGFEQVRECEALPSPPDLLLDALPSSGDETRYRAARLVRLEFALSVAFAGHGSESAHTTTLPPPPSA